MITIARFGSGGASTGSIFTEELLLPPSIRKNKTSVMRNVNVEPYRL